MERVNPVQAIRETRGLNRLQFAILLGISQMVVYCAETGAVAGLSKTTLAGLAAIGENAEQVEVAYLEWRAETRAALQSAQGSN